MFKHHFNPNEKQWRLLFITRFIGHFTRSHCSHDLHIWNEHGCDKDPVSNSLWRNIWKMDKITFEIFLPVKPQKRRSAMVRTFGGPQIGDVFAADFLALHLKIINRFRLNVAMKWKHTWRRFVMDPLIRDLNKSLEPSLKSISLRPSQVPSRRKKNSPTLPLCEKSNRISLALGKTSYRLQFPRLCTHRSQKHALSPFKRSAWTNCCSDSNMSEAFCRRPGEQV